MPRADVLQTNFTSGEISPELRGRVDVQQYHNGAETLENFLVMVQGGLRNRPGTEHIDEVNDSTKRTRIIPFEFSDEQAYILELSDYLMRVYRDDALVEVSGAPITVVTPWSEDEIWDLKYTQSADILYVVHKDHHPQKISRTSHTMWTLTEFGNSDGPYLDPNKGSTTAHITVVTDNRFVRWDIGTPAFIVSDIGKYVEWRDGDVWRVALITGFFSSSLVTADEVGSYYHPPTDSVITESALASTAAPNTVIAFNSNDVGKYLRENTAVAPETWHQITAYTNYAAVTNTAALTMHNTAPTPGTDVITSGDRTVTIDVEMTQDVFVASDTGRQMRFDFAGSKIWGTILTVTDARNVRMHITGQEMPLDPRQLDETLYNNGVTRNWQLGAWSDSTGYPRAVSFHEGRLCFAGSKSNPHDIWMSIAGDFENMAPTEADSSVEDDNAITKTYADNQVSIPVFLSSGPTLLLGTNGSIYQIKASSINEAITPTNITIKSQTEAGAESTVNATKVGVATLFAQKGGKKLRELTYNFEIDRHIANDITVFSSHLFSRGQTITQVSYQEEPYSMLWLLRSDGVLIGVTYDREQKVVAYHKHTLGGASAVVESIATIYDPVAKEDVLYCVVNRLINSNQVRYVEKLTKSVYPASATDNLDMVFLDDHVKYVGADATVITGLGHLEGELVDVVADGSYVGQHTVASGQITLATAAANVYVGLGYTSTVTGLPLEGGSQLGTSQGKRKKATSSTIRVLDSVGMSYGVVGGTAYIMDFREAGEPMDEAPPMRTSDERLTPEGGFEPDTRWTITQTQPYPLNIAYVMTELTTGHG